MYEQYCEIRDSHGYRDADVARGTGISKVVFSEWKSGRSNPKADKLLKIADFLCVPVERLMQASRLEAYAAAYYKDKAAANMAQKLFDSPGRRALFEAVDSMTEEDIQRYADFIRGITSDNNKSGGLS